MASMPEDPVQSVLFQIELHTPDRTMQASARVPDVPLRTTDLLPLLFSFEEALIGMALEKVEAQGERVSCRAGCGACCRQLVPVSEAEARYLAELVQAMPPERRDAIRGRFRRALSALEQHGMLETLRKPSMETAPLEVRRKMGLEYFALKIPCPFLEEESCSIHPHRPTSCREYSVTSPPANCADPGPENIRRVPLRARFSEILYGFNGPEPQPVRWLPLVLALEWTEANPEAPSWPGPELFRLFMSRLEAATK